MDKIILNLIDDARHKFDLLMVLEDINAWVKDLDGHFIMVNQSFINWCDLQHVDQVIGKTDYDLSPTEHADQFRADDQLVLSGRIVKNRLEVIPSKESGTITWFTTSKWPIYNYCNQIIGSFGISRRMKDVQEDGASARELDASIAYIERHYANKLTIEILAKEMNLSVSAIERRFKKHLLQTPRQYITEVRLNHAHELLLKTNKAVSTIAQETGFSDNSHLTRCFIQRFAITPRQARIKSKNVI